MEEPREPGAVYAKVVGRRHCARACEVGILDYPSTQVARALIAAIPASRYFGTVFNACQSEQAVMRLNALSAMQQSCSHYCERGSYGRLLELKGHR